VAQHPPSATRAAGDARIARDVAKSISRIPMIRAGNKLDLMTRQQPSDITIRI
jgi:hypothetical protein